MRFSVARRLHHKLKGLLAGAVQRSLLPGRPSTDSESEPVSQEEESTPGEALRLCLAGLVSADRNEALSTGEYPRIQQDDPYLEGLIRDINRFSLRPPKDAPGRGV